MMPPKDRFVLFVNERKTEEIDPDYTGTLTIDGVEYYLDGWRGKTKAGKPMLSGRAKIKSPREVEARQDREFRRMYSGPSEPGPRPSVLRRPNGEPVPPGDAE